LKTPFHNDDNYRVSKDHPPDIGKNLNKSSALLLTIDFCSNGLYFTIVHLFPN